MPVATDMRPLRTGERQWLFDEEALNNTPSSQDGIELQQELEGRKTTIQFMRSLWLRVASKMQDQDLEATPAKGVMTVGATLVHRFYMRRSLKDFSPSTMAPTILFLASKIEEAPLKLRHIVNATLAKFEPGAPHWEPQENDDNAQPQPMEYKRWEKKILATEEVALEALCFDMAVEQPWPSLRRAVRGLDDLWDDSEPSPSVEYRAEGELGEVDVHVNGSGNGNAAKGKHRATEEVVNELGWAMLNEGYLAPLSVLFRPEINAFAVFVLQLAMLEDMNLHEAMAAGSELAGRFGLDINWSETLAEASPPPDAVGPPSHRVQAERAIAKYMAYCQDRIIDPEITSLINTAGSGTQPFRRRFKVAPSNGLNGERR